TTNGRAVFRRPAAWATPSGWCWRCSARPRCCCSSCSHSGWKLARSGFRERVEQLLRARSPFRPSVETAAEQLALGQLAEALRLQQRHLASGQRAVDRWSGERIAAAEQLVRHHAEREHV